MRHIQLLQGGCHTTEGFRLVPTISHYSDRGLKPSWSGSHLYNLNIEMG